MKFGRKVLEGYLAVAIGILTVVAFIILGGMNMGIATEFIFLDILIIILISVNILIAIIQLRILEKVGGEAAEMDNTPDEDKEDGDDEE